MTKYSLNIEWRFWFCLSVFEWRLLSLASFWQCPCTAYILPLGHACKAWSEQLGPECSEAAGKLPTCIPQPVFLLCLPRPRDRVRGRCPVCGTAVSAVQLQHSGHLVVNGMEVLVLPRTSGSGSCSCKASSLYVDEIPLSLQHLKFLHIFQHFCVLNSSLSYRLLTVLKYSIFKWGFSCKDYVSVISGNKQGAGRRLFFPVIFWHQCEKLTALTKLRIHTSQSSSFPCCSVKQCQHPKHKALLQTLHFLVQSTCPGAAGKEAKFNSQRSEPHSSKQDFPLLCDHTYTSTLL